MVPAPVDSSRVSRLVYAPAIKLAGAARDAWKDPARLKPKLKASGLVLAFPIFPLGNASRKKMCLPSDSPAGGAHGRSFNRARNSHHHHACSTDLFMKTRFRDRIEASELLAEKLTGYSRQNDVSVLAPVVVHRPVILVDDGIGADATVRAAVGALRRRRAGRIVAAEPVIAASTYKGMRGAADEIVAVLSPEDFSGMGHWDGNLSQTTRDEAQTLVAFAAPAHLRRENALEHRSDRGRRHLDSRGVRRVRRRGGSGLPIVRAAPPRRQRPPANPSSQKGRLS